MHLNANYRNIEFKSLKYLKNEITYGGYLAALCSPLFYNIYLDYFGYQNFYTYAANIIFAAFDNLQLRLL